MHDGKKTTTTAGYPPEGRRRVMIESVSPEIDGGAYPVKRAVGEEVVVEADIFADGHEVLSAVLKYQLPGERTWTETAMEPLVNDRWQGRFTVPRLGEAAYTLEAWVDHLKSWRSDLQKKVKAGMDVSIELLHGAELVRRTATRAKRQDAVRLRGWSRELKTTAGGIEDRVQKALDPINFEVACRYPDRALATRYPKALRVVIDPVLARYGAWYEMFPRSCAPEPGRHGTFKDCEAHLQRVADMGFQVLYLPPIHPIGLAFRKGRNNQPQAEKGDPGSPWGIGSAEGGHKSIHPDLGTAQDFRRLVKRAKQLGLTVALDIAFQCSPDHPYVRQHPAWFRKRPDGTIQYAENPPKKYQDIYPIDFETEDWKALWRELRSIFEHWIKEGITVFRVDNPHTKAFAFWDWCINGLKRKYPDLIFLSEAFTRPKVMYRLAKLGFTQSYNYFPWRNSKWELTEYFTELDQTGVRQFFRPNLWPNTPDILPQFLQYGGKPAFMSRLVLAATLGAAYGIYGPAFELCDNRPRAQGTEEYLDSEKYEIKRWAYGTPDDLTELVTLVNRVRRENPALQSDARLVFHPVDNEQLIAYSKTTPEADNILLTVVNLDPHHTQSGWIDVQLDELGIEGTDTYQVHDLLAGSRYLWKGTRNYVELNPRFVPAHIFRVRRRARTERDFDYFM